MFDETFCVEGLDVEKYDWTSVHSSKDSPLTHSGSGMLMVGGDGCLLMQV